MSVLVAPNVPEFIANVDAGQAAQCAADQPGDRDHAVGPDPAVAREVAVRRGRAHRLAQPRVADQHVHEHHHHDAQRDDHELHDGQLDRARLTVAPWLIV